MEKVSPCQKQCVENCLCILHNLTFQLEAEAPALFSRITALAKPVNRSNSVDDTSPIGCFSQQSKSLEREVRSFTSHTNNHTLGTLLMSTAH